MNPVWQIVTDWLSQFFDKKVVIYIVAITYIVIGVLIILSKTSIGRKAIAKLTELYRQGLEINNATKKKVEDVEKLANEKIESLKDEYDKKVAALISIIEFYEESTFSIFEQVPNAKVKNRLLEYKEKYESTKLEINEWVGLTYGQAKEEIQSKVELIQKEKDEQIAALTNEIENLKELVAKFIKTTEEGENGQERKEIENTDPIEENL